MRKAVIVIIVSFIFVVALVGFTILYKMRSKPFVFIEDSMWDDFPESKALAPQAQGPYFPGNDETLVAFDNMLSKAECDYLIFKAQDKFKPSTVGKGKKDVVRTSESAYIKKAGNAWIQSLEQRVAEVLQTKPEHLEPLQVCRYQQGQFYKPHMDSDGNNRRLSTLLVYLNELPPEETGGRTIFPKLGAAIKPKKGTGIAWNNLDPDTFIPNGDTVHAGETITKSHSVKYILNVWSLIGPYNPNKNK